MKKPNVNSAGEKELAKAEEQIKVFDESVRSLTLDRLSHTPKQETEAQTKLSQADIEKSKEIWLKPKRAIGSKEKFNEDYRKEYEYAKEPVCFIAENNEIIGEDIEFWTKPFAGMPVEEWKVPVNKPVWGPRYVAEQIKRCYYHRLTMRDAVTNTEGVGQFYGAMAADSTIQRLDARPASTTTKSVFMGR